MDATTEIPRIRAAQYVRMSTEHQNYSMEGQTIAIAAFALQRNLEIVRTYADAGISGLRLDRRAGLKALLADVLGGAGGFSVILVYDVSRWGRFQDPDESAHYEFICKQAGVRVEYCAEAFDNDGSMTATLVKHLKRAMAAEYSRELSEKVAGAKRGLVEKGYYTGGVCSYGFRRQIVAPTGAAGLVLDHGERKALLGHRVKLVAGPDAETDVVRRIFRQYAFHGLSTASIARDLNAEGIPSNLGLPWTRNRVFRVLRDTKYVGTITSCRRKSRLLRSQAQPQETWVVLADAMPPIVDRKVFEIAQNKLWRPEHRPTDAALIADLRRVLAARGSLSGNIIREYGERFPGLYTKRFGSLAAAYELAGYKQTYHQFSAAARHRPELRKLEPFGLSDPDLLDALRRLYTLHGRLTVALIDAAPELPSSTTCCRRLGDIMRLCELVGCKPTRRQVNTYRGCLRRRAERGLPAIYAPPAIASSP